MQAKQTTKPIQQTGREKFLAQCDVLRMNLKKTRIDSTAKRFNRLDDEQRKAIFILANDAADRFSQLPKLGREHLRSDYESLTESERKTLLMGLKHLAELAALIPWEFTDYAAPCAELQAQRDKENPIN